MVLSSFPFLGLKKKKRKDSPKTSSTTTKTKRQSACNLPKEVEIFSLNGKRVSWVR